MCIRDRRWLRESVRATGWSAASVVYGNHRTPRCIPGVSWLTFFAPAKKVSRPRGRNPRLRYAPTTGSRTAQRTPLHARPGQSKPSQAKPGSAPPSPNASTTKTGERAAQPYTAPARRSVSSTGRRSTSRSPHQPAIKASKAPAKAPTSGTQGEGAHANSNT